MQTLFFFFLESGNSFGRTILYEYELPPSFPSKTLSIVFYDELMMVRVLLLPNSYALLDGHVPSQAKMTLVNVSATKTSQVNLSCTAKEFK